MAGFLSPVSTSTTPDLAEVQRQQQLAQMLMAQGMAPMDTQVVNGYAVRRSPFEALSRVLTAYMGKQAMDKADEMRRQVQASGANEAGQFVDLLRGSPAAPTGQAFQTGANEMGDEPATQQQYTNARAPDLASALKLSMSSQNPMLQQVGGAMLGSLVPRPDKWGTDPRYDQAGNAYLVSEQGNIKPLPGVKARDKQEFVNGMAVNPYDVAPGTVIPQQAPQANPFENLAVPGPNGTIIPNQPVIDAKKAIALAGKTDVKLNVENRLGEGLAGQVGPMVAASHQAAIGAQGAIANSDNIIKAIDTGKVLAGPGSTFRLKGLQIGQALGINGADSTEVLQNTRGLVQGLAQSALSARSQLKGQGQISDFEGKLLERASAGNIDDMTAGEIRVIAMVNKRLAEKQVQMHNQLIDKTKQNPATAPIANFFELPTATSRMVFNPQTGLIERAKD
jgi:hypothetical protein